MNKIIGSNRHGFKNEKLLIKTLNNQKYKNLPYNLKEFINYICIQEKISYNGNTLIKATDIKGTKKSDMIITINNITVGISVKMGFGNSVHQEKVESFINWCKKNTDISNSEADNLRILVWADGTIDGTLPIKKDSNGYVIGRFGSKDFKKLYPEKLYSLDNFFERNKNQIIMRVLFDGKFEYKASYIYAGTIDEGLWISKNEYIRFFINTNINKTYNEQHCGNLTYQSYNASLQATMSSEKKRGDIQFKYGKLKDDLRIYKNIVK